MRRSPIKRRYVLLQLIFVISQAIQLQAYKPMQTYSEGPKIFKISDLDLLIPHSNRKAVATGSLPVSNSTYDVINQERQQQSLRFANGEQLQQEQSTIFVTPVNQVITTMPTTSTGTSDVITKTTEAKNDSDGLNEQLPKNHQNHNNSKFLINSVNQQQSSGEKTLTKLQQQEQMSSTGRAVNPQYNHNNNHKNHHHHHDINLDSSPLIKSYHSPSLISPLTAQLPSASPLRLHLPSHPRSSISTAAATISEPIGKSKPTITYQQSLKDGISERFTPAEAVASQHIKQAHYQSEYIAPAMSSTSTLQNLYDIAPPQPFSHEDNNYSNNLFAIEHQPTNGINHQHQNSYAAPPSGPIQSTYIDQQQQPLSSDNHNLYSNTNTIGLNIAQDNGAVGVLPATAMEWPTDVMNNENNNNKHNNDILHVSNDDQTNNLEESNVYPHYVDANAINGIENGMLFDTPPPDWLQHHIVSEATPSPAYHLDDDDHNDFHEYVTKAPLEGRVKKYSYFYIGRKLWYIPLYFTVWFSIYVLWLIIKSISRHKVNLPNHYVSRRSSENDSTKLEAINQMTENILNGIERFKAQYVPNASK